MARIPPLATLRAFDAAVRHASFSRAGEELHLTHGAISRQIAQLEAAVGRKLFRRLPRGVTPTPAGARFHAAVAQALARLVEGMAELKAPQSARTRVRISVLPSLGARWLLPRLKTFRAAHPDIDVVIEADPGFADFTRSDIDLAIRYGRGPWSRVRTKPLMDERLFPVCAPAFLGRKKLANAADLRGLTLLHDGDHDDWGIWLATAGWKRPSDTSDELHNDYNLTLEAAVNGFGIAMGRSRLVADELRAGRLIRACAMEVPNPKSYFVVTPQRKLSEAASRFVDWLRQAATDDTITVRPNRSG